MAKRNVPKTTPEDEARFDENLRRLRERIAEREARSASSRRNARAAESWIYRLRLRVARAIAPSREEESSARFRRSAVAGSTEWAWPLR